MTYKKHIFIVGCLFSTLVILILLPFELIIQVIGPVDAFLQHYFPWLGVSVGKLGHLVAFCVLTVVVLISSERFGVKFWLVIFGLLFIGVITELAQLLIPGRTTRYTDVLWNIAGIVIGYCCLTAYKWNNSKRITVKDRH